VGVLNIEFYFKLKINLFLNRHIDPCVRH